MSSNHVIGNGNRIPWYLPDDFKWFKQMTTGQMIVMGRKTFDSIGRLLPNRNTVVLSRNQTAIAGVRVCSELTQLNPAQEEQDVFICGGAQIYTQALPLCSDLYLTLVKRRVDGDAFFPSFEDQFEPVAVLEDRPEFQIVHYRSRRLEGFRAPL